MREEEEEEEEEGWEEEETKGEIMRQRGREKEGRRNDPGCKATAAGWRSVIWSHSLDPCSRFCRPSQRQA